MSWFKLASGVGGFLGKRKAAKNQAAWDRYNNAMAGIQAGQARNSIAANVAMNRSQHAQNKVAIEASRLMAAAKVKAGAAAAGVAGGAVESTIFDVGRNAGNRLKAETDKFDASILVSDQQRRQVSMSRAMAQKPITQTPSFLSSMATTGLSILGDEINSPSSRGTQLEGADTQTPDGWDRLRNMLMI